MRKVISTRLSEATSNRVTNNSFVKRNKLFRVMQLGFFRFLWRQHRLSSGQKGAACGEELFTATRQKHLQVLDIPFFQAGFCQRSSYGIGKVAKVLTRNTALIVCQVGGARIIVFNFLAPLAPHVCVCLRLFLEFYCFNWMEG